MNKIKTYLDFHHIISILCLVVECAVVLSEAIVQYFSHNYLFLDLT